MTQCIICGNSSFSLKQVNGFNIDKCQACGLEFTQPMPEPDVLSDFYTGYSNFRAGAEVCRRNAERHIASLARFMAITSDSKILDYGCGNNYFVEVCRAKQLVNSFGYDPFQQADGLNTLSLDKVRQQTWDVICLWDVLEHVTSPVNLLEELSQLLNENGIVVCITVSIESKIPFQYKPPEHTLYFTQKSLNLLAENSGFKILDYAAYDMEQHADVYLSILLRTMPEHYKPFVTHSLPTFVEVPTNEVFVVMQKTANN